MKPPSLKLRVAEWISHYSEAAYAFVAWFLPVLTVFLFVVGIAIYSVHYMFEHGVIASARALTKSPGGRVALGAVAVLALAGIFVWAMQWADDVLEEERLRRIQQDREASDKTLRDLGL